VLWQPWNRRARKVLAPARTDDAEAGLATVYGDVQAVEKRPSTDPAEGYPPTTERIE
jgi:hypothetical protein